MQSKNAIGNLINRYKAVLKKCHVLNTFGTLAIVGALTLGAGLAHVEHTFAASLSDIDSNIDAPTEIRDAGTLAPYTVTLSHITGHAVSTINAGAELVLTGKGSNVLFENSVSNSGKLTLGTNITGTGTANIRGGLINTGTLSAQSQLEIQNALTLDGGEATFERDLTVTGKTTLSSGINTFNGASTFTGAVTNGNTIGTSTFNGNTIFQSEYTGRGNATFSGETTFNGAYSNTGTSTLTGQATFNQGYSSGVGTLNVGDATTGASGTVSIGAHTSMNINAGGTLNIVNGLVDVSNGTLSVDGGATTFATGADGVLKAKAEDFASFNDASGTLTVDNWLLTGNVEKKLNNAGRLILTGQSGSMEYSNYTSLLTNLITGGTLQLENVSISTANTYLKDILSGTDLSSNVVLGSNSSQLDGGTFTSGRTAILGGVNGDVQNFGTLTLTGAGAANGVLVQGGVANNSILNLQSGVITGTLTNLGTVNINGITIVKGNVDVNSSGNIHTQSGSFTVEGMTALGGGTLRTTNSNSGNDIKGASATFLHNLLSGIDGHIIVEQNAYTVLGGGNRAYAETIFGNSGHDWGTGVTAALFIVKPHTLASGGSIMVDGKSTGIGVAGNNEAKFTANSLLVMDATGVGASAALASTGGTLTVDSGAKLVINGGDVGTVTVVSGFTTGSSIADKAWGFDDDTLANVSTVNETLKIDSVLWDGGKFTVNLVQNAFILDGVDNLIKDFMDAARAAGVSGAFFDFMDNKNNSQVSRVKASEVVPQAAAIAGVARGIMNAAFAAAEAIGLRNTVGGIGTQKPAVVAVNEGAVDTSRELGVNAGSDAQLSNTINNGFGVWLMPLYKWSTISGIESGVLDGGYETGLGGLSLGADYTFDNNFRLGFAFNLGAGYTESKGDFSGTDNDFDFYGLSLYTGYTYENLNISADVGYSASTHDVTQKMGVTSYKADIFADVWTAGLGLAYTFNTDFMSLTPHAGVRYVGANTYAYDIADLNMDSDHQSVWYFPVGVTLSKEIVTSNGWILTPKLDVGFIAAAGDLKANSSAGMSGVNATIEKETTNVDGFAFNGGVGFDLAHADNGVSVGLNYNLQASEHETGHMVNATFRYDF